MQVSAKGAYDCIEAFSETDFTEELKRVTVPAPVLQGNDDQIVPLDDSGVLSAKIMPNVGLITDAGVPHGMCTTMRTG